MIAAVDTNILLDILIPDEPFSGSSKNLLDYYLSRGKLILNDVVLAELAASFFSEEELMSFIADTRMTLVYSSRKSLYMAGSKWAEYARKSAKNRLSCSKCGHAFEETCPQCEAILTKRLRVLADFLIGAHALVHADCILSRDLGVYRTYFSDLKVIDSI